MVAYFGQQMPDEVPEWAMERARKEMGYYNLGGYADNPEIETEHELARYIENRITKAFACYIMKHEDAPVDPDALAVREIIAAYHGSGVTPDAYIDGNGDFERALAAYKAAKGGNAVA